MKKSLLILTITILLALISLACAANWRMAETVPANNPSISANLVNVNFFNVSLATEPAVLKPNQKAKLILSIQNADARDLSANDLEVVHEKLMHLIIVSNDLSFFNHIHPVAEGGGIFAVETEFPLAGNYQLYLDYNPKSVGHRLGHMEITVSGPPETPVPLVADSSDSKIVDGLRVTLKLEKPLRANQALTLSFDLADAQTGKPITDLQPYLGAFAHFNAISQDNVEYLHAHPLQEAESPDARGGPTVGTRTIFPKSGLYKLWAQFERNNQVIVVPFVLAVGEGEQPETAMVAKTENGIQKLTVTVSERGFEPSSIELKPGIPAQLTFFRADGNNCAHEVLVNELGIRKELPVGQSVTIDFTPDKAGTYNFACGMGMFRGSIQIKS